MLRSGTCDCQTPPNSIVSNSVRPTPIFNKPTSTRKQAMAPAGNNLSVVLLLAVLLLVATAACGTYTHAHARQLVGCTT